MGANFAPELIEAEDSFVVGFERHSADYWIRCLFALATEHPEYTPPARDHYGCYRRGWLKALGIASVDHEWSRFPVAYGPSGEVDFGSFTQLGYADGLLTCDGFWGRLRIACDAVSMELEPA